jgi:acetyl esterase/lipase
MKIKTCILWFLIFGFFSQIFAQPLHVKLWPQSVPQSINNSLYKERNEQTWGRNCYAGVVDPELIIYPAPKEKLNGTAIVICPGGGYERIAYVNEGDDIVVWLNAHGITAIILKYRLPSDSIMKDKTIGPLQDAQEAIRIVRRNAKEWNIDKLKIGIMGFSAGGHLASSLCTHFDQNTYTPIDTTSARPDFAILVYPVISMIRPLTHIGSSINLLGETPDTVLINFFSNELQVTSATPPTFLVHSADDGAVPVANSLRYFSALHKNNIPSEIHIYQTGGHGYGLAKNGKSESQWPEACIHWLKTSVY